MRLARDRATHTSEVLEAVVADDEIHLGMRTPQRFARGKYVVRSTARPAGSIRGRLATAEGWDAVVPAALQEFSKYDGDWIAAPVNVHSTNWLWLNKAALDKAGGAEPGHRPEAEHQRIAVLQTPHAAGDAAVDEADALLGQRGGVDLVVGERAIGRAEHEAQRERVVPVRRDAVSPADARGADVSAPDAGAHPVLPAVGEPAHLPAHAADDLRAVAGVPLAAAAVQALAGRDSSALVAQVARIREVDPALLVDDDEALCSVLAPAPKKPWGG
mgnify:CR=1 FL=1